MKATGVKHTASFWLKQVNTNPEKFGRTEKDIKAIDKFIEKAEQESD